MHESSVIDANESLGCPQCEKMDLKIIQSLLERVQIHKNAGKPNHLWDLEDFSDKTNKGTTVTKQKNSCGSFR